LTERIALEVVSVSPVRGSVRAAVTVICPSCELPSAAVLLRTNANSPEWMSLHGLRGDICERGWELREFWPTPPAPEVPELLPADVARAYLQAERNFPVKGNEEAAGTMYRKALDVGLKKIDPSLTGTLGAKLKALAKAGRLTQDIADWSDEVRDLGNEATHDEDPISRSDLETLRSFTEMVLRYLFTLPEMVKQRRAARTAAVPLGGAAP
jgi:hypothetical protein